MFSVQRVESRHLSRFVRYLGCFIYVWWFRGVVSSTSGGFVGLFHLRPVVSLGCFFYVWWFRWVVSSTSGGFVGLFHLRLVVSLGCFIYVWWFRWVVSSTSGGIYCVSRVRRGGGRTLWRPARELIHTLD